jgi:UDPglucose 6-dehydrogenase
VKISVFGIGYVGLVQAAVLAEVGHDVTCVDIDGAKITRLRAGQIPIFEPGLDVLVHQNHAAGRLSFGTDGAVAVKNTSVSFIAVGTPPDEDGAADLKYVLAVAESIARHMERPHTIITKSTVPVGTSDKIKAKVAEVLRERQVDIRYHVVSNPEFLKEGSAVNDCMRPDRIVVGTESAEAEALLREIYAPFNRIHEKFIVMDVRSAELTKYAANCMLATKISFMNEMANLADKLGADIEHVRQGIGSDPRIGYQFIYPGAGYGGSCFPKDVQALIRAADEIGFEARVLKAVEARNAEQKHLIFEKIDRHFGGDLAGREFALWGLAFKPNTDDMREAPSRVLMEALWSKGARIRAYDPEAMIECTRIYGTRNDLELADNKYSILKGADALIVMTEWRAFQAPDFPEIKALLKTPIIFDGRNLFNPAALEKQGIAYYGIGRGRVPPFEATAEERSSRPAASAGFSNAG